MLALSTLFSHMIGGLSNRQLKSVKDLVIPRRFGVPMHPGDSIDRLEPLLKCRSLERITWASTEDTDCFESRR